MRRAIAAWRGLIAAYDAEFGRGRAVAELALGLGALELMLFAAAGAVLLAEAIGRAG